MPLSRLKSFDPIHPGWMLVAFLLTFVTWGIASNDYFCSAFSAAFAAALSVGVIDAVAKLSTSNPKIVRRVRLTSVGIVPVLLIFTPLLHLSSQRAFQIVFGHSPPDGISGCYVTRNFDGGSGDFTLIMYFRATPEAAQRILTFAPFVSDSNPRLEEWREAGSDWTMLPAVWSSVAAPHLAHFWNRLDRFEAPVFLRSGESPNDWIFLMHDPKSSRFIVVLLH